jgi:glycosyltransferase involved in cell wall biosynthesis
MKIGLIHNIQSTGSALYRLEMPHAHLDNTIKGLTFYSAPNPFSISPEGWDSLDVIISSRMWGNDDYQIQLIRERCNQHNVRLILDLDDYWVLESGHSMYALYREKGMSDLIRKHIKIVDHVICTNDFLADKIKVLNKNVTVIPNCTYKFYKQFIPDPTPSERVRFGWFGGAQHYEDIILMQQGIGVLSGDQNLLNQVEILLGGWNENPMYYAYEKIFTADYRIVDNYRRIQAADIYSYVGGYNFVDVCLAPLRDTTFNRCKSELKIIEAAAMGKALIASDVYPYNTVLRHGENALLVKESRPRDWYKAIKTLANDSEMREALAANLQVDVDKRFNVDYWGKVRMELYKSLL